MKCLNCGAQLKENTKECTECGTIIEETKQDTETRKFIPDTDFNLKKTILECIKLIIKTILKPASNLKNKIDEYTDIKKTGTLIIFVSLIRTIINLLGNMISTIFMKEINIWNETTKLNISIERLKNINYIDLIFKQFFGYIIAITIIAGIYYIISLTMKKNINYLKLIAISTVSSIPFILTTNIICIIISYIYVPLSIFIAIASFIYTIMTLTIAVNNELNFENINYKIYFHTICLTIIFMILYYTLRNVYPSINIINAIL